MRGGIKQLLLVTLVIVCFVSFDAVMDYLGRYIYPALFSLIVYPVDLAGAIEYSVGFSILYMSNRRGVEWLTTGTVACLAYSIVIIGQKLIFNV